MKKRLKLFSVFAILALFLVMVVSGCNTEETTDGDTPAEDNDEVFDLSFATFWPGTSFQVSEAHESWIKEVKQRTGGRVNITMQAGEALLGAREIYEGVASGVADIGSTCPAYTPGMFPLMEVFELPGYLNVNAEAASMTVNEGYKKMVDDLNIDEFDDVKVLFVWATGPGNIMSSKPVRTLEDFSGMEIRAVGGTVPPIELLGAVPHAMPMSESYLALEQGLVEGIVAPNETLEVFRLAEVVDYVTVTPFLYNVVFIKIMNMETWNSLPPDIQAVFEELNEEFVQIYGQITAEHTDKGLRYGIDEHGLEIIELSKEEENRWLNIIDQVSADWAEKMNNQGLPGSEALEIVRELDNYYSQIYGN